MDAFINGLLGGIVPAIVMLVVYFIAMAGRLAKIETDICWLKKELLGCRPRLKDHTP